ncbi:MAG: tetratricopeptide repeat protein [bacterium]|nr:tetratricopeptide repeat protein [bacterium]
MNLFNLSRFLISKYCLFLLTFLCTCTFIFAQSYEDYERKSDEKYKEGDYQYAMVLINKAIQLNDTSVRLLLKKSDLEFELSGPREAFAIAKSASDLDKSNPMPYNQMATFYNSGGLIDSAIAMYNKAIELANSDLEKYMYISNRGTAKLGMRDFEGAAEDFEIVLEYDSMNFAALNNIFSVYQELGMFDKAINSLEKVLAIDSTLTGPYVNLGFLYSSMDSVELAISYFDKALEIQPNEPLVFSNRGYAYYQLGEYQKAFSDVNRSLELYPSNSYAYRNLALIYLATDSNEEACRALKYAYAYGFTQRYGSEVEDLLRKHCK